MNNFIEGFRVYKPGPKAPSFIIANGEFNISEIIPYLNGNHIKGKLRFNIKESKGGKYYAEVDTYIPNSEKTVESIKESIRAELSSKSSYPEEIINPDDIPF